MLNFNINLTSLAIILWCGMLIIAGSIWVLASQVRRLADLIQEQPTAPARVEAPVVQVDLALPLPRATRRGAPVRVRGAVRGAVGGPASPPAPRRPERLVGRVDPAERRANRPGA